MNCNTHKGTNYTHRETCSVKYRLATCKLPHAAMIVPQASCLLLEILRLRQTLEVRVTMVGQVSRKEVVGERPDPEGGNRS